MPFLLLFGVCLQDPDSRYVSEIVFQLQPTPRDSSPPPPTPLQGVDFESIFGRFRVVFESILSRDSKTTRNRLENNRKTTRNRLPGEGGGGGGGRIRGGGL